MKITTKILFIFLLLSFFLILPSSSYAAGVHLVQPFILVPKDWKNIETAEDIESYKRVIVSNLRSVQQFYASKLSGKSFNFNPSVEVIYSDKNIAGNSDKEIGGIFGDLNSDKFLNFFGNDLISLEENKVKVIWIIGMHTFKGIYAQGGSRGVHKGIALMPYVDLFGARGDLGFGPQQFSKHALAHELGHAFGLNWSGYGKGHPCTEASLNECIDGTPQPYPPAIEWKSVMGYNAPSQQFPDVDFNNSLANPEIKKLYQSPFLNPENDPAPEPSLDSGVKVPDFFRFGSVRTIAVGTVLDFSNDGDKLFGEQQGKIEFISAIDKTTPLSQDHYEIKRWESSKIEIFIKESAESPNTQRRWKLRITTASSRVWQAEEDIIIKGKDFNRPSLILTASLLTTCGEKRQPISAPVNFGTISAAKDVGTSVITDTSTGKGEISLEVEDPRVGDIYALAPFDLPGVLETPKEEVLTLESADIQAGHKIVNINIHYPSCPATKDSQPTPIPTPEETVSPTPSVTTQPGPIYTLAPVPTPMPTAGITEPTPAASAPVETPIATPENATEPTPTTRLSPIPTSIPEQTQVLISNYSDFRSDNAPGDAGSQTMTINNPSGQTITWKLSTLIPSATRRVFVRVITGDEYKDYEPLEMRDSETVSVAGINIQARMIKKVVRMTVTVNGQDQEIDLNNPEEIITSLPGNAGQAQRFSFPFVIEYSNGEVVRSAIGVNYQPQGGDQATPVASASLVPLPSSAAQPTAEPSVSSAPSCGDFTFRYNECFACNQSRRVLQDSCGQFDNTEINPGVDPACASWCSTSPSPETRKEIIRITINEQEIDPSEFDSGFSLNLPGTAGQPQTFSIPVVVYYSDDTKRNLAYIFNYQPSNQQPCPYEYKYPECDSKGPGWVHEVWQNCEGKYDFRNIQFQAGVCGDSGQQSPPQEDSCLEDRSDQYPQCGGTAGLEDKDPTHTYLITRVKDCQGNILRYEQEDLGDQGQCQN